MALVRSQFSIMRLARRSMQSAKQRRPRPADMPITSALNVALVAIVLTSACGLLWLASHGEAWYVTLLAAILFSYVLLTNYALLHEASHGNLHGDPRFNYLLGM